MVISSRSFTSPLYSSHLTVTRSIIPGPSLAGPPCTPRPRGRRGTRTSHEATQGGPQPHIAPPASSKCPPNVMPVRPLRGTLNLTSHPLLRPNAPQLGGICDAR
eukprot:8053506-Pyramimonas_sp.AAC.1